MSSVQNHDTKSDSGNDSSCYDTSSKHRMTPTLKNSSNDILFVSKFIIKFLQSTCSSNQSWDFGLFNPF